MTYCSLVWFKCLGFMQLTMWAVFHSSVTTVSLYLIPPVDVAVSGDADVSIQTQAEVFGQVEEVIKGAIVDIHKQSLEL